MSSANDPRIPDIGSVTQAERMFRVNWVAAEIQGRGGAALLQADVVSRFGRNVRLVDVRDADELMGPMGHVPGVDWVPLDGAEETLSALDPDGPVVLICGRGDRSSTLAAALKQRGLRFVAAMAGGMVAWRRGGLAVARDRSLLDRRGALHPIDAPWEVDAKHLTRADLEDHLGDAMSLRWVKLASLLATGRLCCVDGRDVSGVLGTPGGDAGEFVLALAALESMTARAFSPDAIEALFRRRLDAFGRFYVHTDIASSNALIAAMRADPRFEGRLPQPHENLGWRAFFASPPEALRGALTEHLMNPAHLGCGHLKLARLNADAYGARRALIDEVLRAYYRAQWAGSTETELSVLPGGHSEGAVVDVRVSESLAPFTPVPMVSPSANGTSIFVRHPQVSTLLRRYLAEWLLRQSGLVEAPTGGVDALHAEMERMGAAQAGATLGAIAKGLPVFAVEFDGPRLASVTHVGAV
ncbi:MAG: rhodanese-like domain-containing protein [Polyangiales bacterium]